VSALRLHFILSPAALFTYSRYTQTFQKTFRNLNLN